MVSIGNIPDKNVELGFIGLSILGHSLNIDAGIDNKIFGFYVGESKFSKFSLSISLFGLNVALNYARQKELSVIGAVDLFGLQHGIGLALTPCRLSFELDTRFNDEDKYVVFCTNILGLNIVSKTSLRKLVSSKLDNLL